MKVGSLIGSTSSLDEMKIAIQKHFFWKDLAVLTPINEKEYSVSYPESSPRTGKTLTNIKVVKNKNRYRLERI
jgi:hypothetical protein